MPRVLVALLLILLTHSADARRRAVGAPGGNAHVGYELVSTDLISSRRDLWPLRPLAGRASIVALGDATHGTHEFFTVKLRVIDLLVREHGFDVLSIEAPFAITERLNAYVLGAPENPRAILQDARTRLLYLFWDVEELLAVIEWIREYNVHRGDRPPLEIAGADIYDYEASADAVIAYLFRTDPAAAADAVSQYACFFAGNRSPGCESNAKAVRDAIVRNAADRESETAFHHADVVTQAFHFQAYEPRDESMAANLLWILEHRSAARRVIHWGHQEHVGKTPSSYVRGRSMGTVLAERLGTRYVAIGTLTGSGSFLQWERRPSGAYSEVTLALPDPESGSYEAQFREQGHAAMIVPLAGGTDVRSFRTAGTTGGWRTLVESLPAKLDAVIYVDRTTPTRPLR